jgi:hypothetical protein
VKRLALLTFLPLALLLIPVPGGASAATTCTAIANGMWSARTTWSCSARPRALDAVVIPAGKTVTIADGDTAAAAGLTLAGGALALGEDSELDVTGLAVSGGSTLSGTLSEDASSQVFVTLPPGAQAAIDSSGLTLSGVYLTFDGEGSLGIAGPIAARDGAWVESGVDTTWTGSAPWLLGGDSGTPATSGFAMQDARLTISGPIAALSADEDGEIQLNGSAALYKQDATASVIGVVVSLDSLSEVHVLAGELAGSFRGSGALYVAAGATLGLDGSGLQLAPVAIGLTGSALEIEPGADVTLALPGEPALLSLAIGTGAALDVSTDSAIGPVTSDSPPEALAQDVAIGASGTLSIGSGGGMLALADHHALTGSGTLDGSLDNSAGTVSPSGVLHLTGDYAQGAGGTLALGLRSATDGDSLLVDGTVDLAGALRVSTSYSPAPTASPPVLAASVKPDGTFGTTVAPLSAGHAWKPGYGAAGVTLAVGSAAAGRDAPTSLKAPSLKPAVPVVGGRTRCLPGKWSGADKLSFHWLRGGKPIAKATAARYRVGAADLGRKLACRVTAAATGGAHAMATSTGARARVGLAIGRVVATRGHALSVVLRCAAGERRCSGSLRILVAGRAVAAGRFALRSPGGVVLLRGVGAAARLASGPAVVRASYRNGAGQGRDVLRRLRLTG